jgi:IclR family transcriptional regulator, KDG regulon repressor
MSKTVEKALRLLDIFTEEKPYWRLDEISKFTEIPKPTAYRLLQKFVQFGYLQRISFQQDDLVIDGEVYGLGTKFLELGERVAGRLDIRQIAYPYMKKIQTQFNEAVQIVMREQNQGIYIEKIDSTRPVRLYTRVGRYAPLYAGACTRTLLAYLSDEEIDRILENPLTQYASQTPTSIEEVWKLVEQTRESGFAYSDSELEEGSVSIAVPIFDRFGTVPYSISMAGFSTSLPREKVSQFVGPLWEAAAEISKKIGYTYPYPYGKNFEQQQKEENRL